MAFNSRWKLYDLGNLLDFIFICLGICSGVCFNLGRRRFNQYVHGDDYYAAFYENLWRNEVKEGGVGVDEIIILTFKQFNN